jgi:hypothetical protein
MPITLPPALVRTNYYTWPPGSGGSYDPNADPDNPDANPAEATPVAGLPSNGTMATDEEQYFRPLERIHGMGLHGSGVAYGMDVQCTLGATSVLVTPGIALDPTGKHIFLASGGNAAIGPGEDYPGTPPITAQVSAAGVNLPVSGLSGNQYIVAQWWETWDSGSYYSDGINQFDDTPWLQFVTDSEYDPDVHIVLGKVNLNVSGEVAGVSYGDVGGLQRTNVTVPAQTVQLQRATVSGETISSIPWGQLRAREGGGIEVVTENASDQVNVIGNGGGTFSSMTIAANSTGFGETMNPSVTVNSTEAQVNIGASGYSGELQMYDGGTATMFLQAKNGVAAVQQLNAFQNGLIDSYTTFFHCHGTDFCLDGRSHNNNRALVDWGNQLIINFANDYQNGVQITGDCIADNNLTVEGNLQVDGVLMDGNGTPLEGNPARKVNIAVLLAGASDFGNWGGSNSQDIDIGHSSALTAMAYFNFSQYYVSVSYNAAGCAEITAIDGNSTGAIIVGNGILGSIAPSVVNSSGQNVTFQTRAGDDSLAVAATCVVFFE